MSRLQIREKAIEATIARMRQEGFEKVRLVDVAKELGVSHAALYGHFADKEALLDAVSERWLLAIDAALEEICRRRSDPIAKIHAWFLTLHRLKRKKVLNDRELYRAFDHAAQAKKPFVTAHLANCRRQLTGLAREALEQERLKEAAPDKIAAILKEGMIGFTHPKLVAETVDERREPLLKQTLDTLLSGLE